MPKRPKRPRDPNQLAKLIVDIATGEVRDTEKATRTLRKKRAAPIRAVRRRK